MKTRKGLAAVAAALSGVLALSACGGGGEAKDDGPASLRMTVWSANEAHLKLFNEIADEYRKSHPDVAEITFDPLPFDNYTTTLTTQIAGGNAPDLAWIFENSAPDFVASGALRPLDDTLRKTDGYQYDDLSAATLKLWQEDGKLYAYPFSTSPFGVFVNTDMVKKAGQKTPAELIAAGQWTWDNALATAGATAAESGKAGLVIRDFDYKGWDNLSTFWTGWGAQAWSEDGRSCGFASPEMVDAMTTLHKAIFSGKALPGPGTTADFFAGDAAMTVTQISRASLLKDDGFGWDLVPLPAGPKGPYAVVGQAGLGVMKKGPHAEQAADFLAFFTNPANSAKLAQFFPPPRTSQLTAETLGKTNPKLKPEQLQKVVVDGITSGVVKPSHAGQAELSQQVRAGLDPLWQPNADVKAVLDGVCAKIQPLLAK
ncbi:sugar ABC transporter substrate-binding protein [Micromonospora sp. WMMD998]|uniref:ABC transporter substrate-binding protein n=1 Tax=Micromonospora sp. WMMD998 TaxID=3016092 RepID=UPI00249CA0B7|nr:sugar ABC transporter substrate-binding protein [Micromonospora sp. WMMD998]WFE39349.1 sugar ABC transporter substrate-binding protein [Micromonospora sp. WMMD998]